MSLLFTFLYFLIEKFLKWKIHFSYAIKQLQIHKADKEDLSRKKMSLLSTLFIKILPVATIRYKLFNLSYQEGITIIISTQSDR